MRFHLLVPALMALPFAVGGSSFLQQTSNNTWVLGNDIWNITQGPIYGTKLYYQGKDAIGSAAGHYVGAGIDCVFCTQDHTSDILQMEKTI
jgi:rhamnogalacturonan endolyase